MKTVTVFGIERIPLVEPGDDLGHLIFEACLKENLELLDGDVIVVSQKVVSKSEGLLYDISKIRAGPKARSLSRRAGKDPRLIELILRDSMEVLKADRKVLVVRRRDGFICMNAGVDKSNVGGRLTYTRLPVNADFSASQLRVKLEALSRKKLAVIVGDTYSRPQRVGQVEFAIGISGIEPIVDYRGQEDLFGYALRYKYVGFADEVAAAAELVMGQGTERTPVAVVRGLTRVRRSSESSLSKKLLLRKHIDLFSRIS